LSNLLEIKEKEILFETHEQFDTFILKILEKDKNFFENDM
jgi:hypothetical protein